jgi:hypothetical protein
VTIPPARYGSAVILAVDWTAVGTLALAGITLVLAIAAMWSARAASRAATAAETAASAAARQADLESEQLRLTEVAFNASIQPLLVDIPNDYPQEPRERVTFASGATQSLAPHQVSVIPRSGEAEPQYLCLSVALRNVGPAAAVMVACGLFAGELHPTWPGDFNKTIVTPGEIVRISVSMPLDRPELEPLSTSVRSGSITARVAYRDVAGMQTLWTDAHVTVGTTNNDNRVRQVAVYRDLKAEPMLLSGPADS